MSSSAAENCYECINSLPKLNAKQLGLVIAVYLLALLSIGIGYLAIGPPFEAVG